MTRLILALLIAAGVLWARSRRPSEVVPEWMEPYGDVGMFV